MGVLSWGGLVSPKFSAPPSGETMRQTPNVLEVKERARGPLNHHAKFGGARISPAAGAAKNVEFFVCLFVRLLTVRHCEPDFDMKALVYRNDFDTVG